MSADHPFLFKVQIQLAPPGDGIWYPSHDPNAAGIGIFDVYAKDATGPVVGATCLTIWRPAGKSSALWRDSLWAGPRYVGLKGEPLDPAGQVVGFGNALMFSSALASAAAIAIRFDNPAGLDWAANPPPPPSDRGFGVWRAWEDGFSDFLGWPDTKGVYWMNLSIQVPAALGLWSVGAPYLRAVPLYPFTGHPGVDPHDLTAIDISGEDYSGLQLRQANFRGAEAGATNFENAELLEAVFHAAGLAKARFARADLSGVALQECDAAGAKFGQACLLGTRVARCDLTGADLVEAVLIAAEFGSCTFKDARLTGAVLIDATFEHCGFENVSFRAADLRAAIFKDCSFPNADFGAADLRGASFFNCDLRGAKLSEPARYAPYPEPRTDFTGSKIDAAFLGAGWSNLVLTDVVLTGAPPSDLKALHAILNNMQLTGADLRKADFTGAILHHTGLSQARLSDAVFAQADLRDCDLSRSDLDRAAFTGAQLQGDASYQAAVLTGASLQDASFKDANLSGADLSFAFFSGDEASLAGATVVRANFANAYLNGTRFTDVAQKAFAGANFSGACLINAHFNAANCSTSQGDRVRFTGACLQGADFTDALLDGADLADAGVALAAGSIMVTVMRGWPPRPISLTPSYESTKGIEAATGSQTVCPSGVTGPCSGAKLASPQAPVKWPPG